MKLLNRDVDYSVRALALVAAAAPAVVPVSGMARNTGVPRPFLRKILQKLNRAGVLRSRKGKGGGFVLAKKPEEIYLTELISLFQGPVALNDCYFDDRLCQRHKTCRLRSRIGALEADLLMELESITLGSLI